MSVSDSDIRCAGSQDNRNDNDRRFNVLMVLFVHSCLIAFCTTSQETGIDNVGLHHVNMPQYRRNQKLRSTL